MPSDVKIHVLKDGKESIFAGTEDFPRVDAVPTVDANGDMHYGVPKRTYVETFSLEDFKIRFEPVTELIIHNNEWGCKITTHDKNVTYVSNNATTIAWSNEENKLVRVKYRDLNKFRHVIPKVVDTSESIVPIVSAPVRNLCKTVNLNETLGYFIGSLIGDGWSVNGDSIGIANVDDDVAQGFKDGIEYLGFDSNKIRFASNPHLFEGRESYSETYSFYSQALAGVVERWIGHLAKNKHLPTFFMRAPLEFREGLLAGLIDTDGTSTWAKSNDKKQGEYMMFYSTISERLAVEIVELSRSLGIRATDCSYLYKRGTEHRIVFNTMSLIGKRLPLKLSSRKEAYDYFQDIWKTEKQTGPSSKTDIVPFPLGIYDIYRKHVYCSDLYRTKAGKSLESMLFQSSKRGYISRHGALTLLSHNSEVFPEEWKRIVNDRRITWTYCTALTGETSSKKMMSLVINGEHKPIITQSGIVIYS